MIKKAEATRARIENAAIHLFARQGIQETSTRELAEAAQVAEGSLYRYFPSKDALVKALFDRHYSELAERWDDLAREKTDPRDKLSHILHDVCGLYDEEPDRFRFLLLTQHQALPYGGQNGKTPVSVLYDIISGGITKGVFRAACPDLMTAFVLGLITQPPVFMIYKRLGDSMYEIRDELVTAALACLGTKEPGANAPP